ncbi:hypothetical protein CEUSTIGMA_g5222.t1 [Chlamydomonas eustigma]|uniref:Uncharacterized protein n=1 Tax=Chlamydomonas eustigma TaxID=1157962 RepID=A0A250X4D2_9CHLO|nr:hypothetical protein CEUSTIGMA_g5222.t1 [Chlamydomonas eustigma]|eukprot:GAX77779.1 hypothetical protein CEUSTIGMA_g5222.t1 [Chlamydomonas eustigma]
MTSVASWPVGLRVLCVDDCDTTLKIVSTMLQKCGYQVTTVTNGQDALRMLKDRTRPEFDLVLSDVMMPDMDGFRLLELIGLEMGVPVIMMSSNGETSTVLRGVTHGAVDFLIKPVRLEELRNLWQHVIRRRKDLVKEDSDEQNLEKEEAVFDVSKKRKELEHMEEGLDRSLEEDGGASKKARVVWSVEMHGQFVNAVNQLGIDKAVPKKILEIMQVDGLTRENVASHLQKYRLYLKRVASVSGSGLPVGMMPGLVSSSSSALPAASSLSAGASSHHRSPPAGASSKSAGAGAAGLEASASSRNNSGAASTGGGNIGGAGPMNGQVGNLGGVGVGSSAAGSLSTSSNVGGVNMFGNTLMGTPVPGGLMGPNPLMGPMGGSLIQGLPGIMPGLGQGGMPLGLPGMPISMPFMQGMGMPGVMPQSLVSGHGVSNLSTSTSGGGAAAGLSRQVSMHQPASTAAGPGPQMHHHHQHPSSSFNQQMLMQQQQLSMNQHMGNMGSTAGPLNIPPGMHGSFPGIYNCQLPGSAPPNLMNGSVSSDVKSEVIDMFPTGHGQQVQSNMGSSLGSGMNSLAMNALSLQSPGGSTISSQLPIFSTKAENVVELGMTGPMYSVADTSEIAAALDGLYHDNNVGFNGPDSEGLATAVDGMLDVGFDAIPKSDLLGEVQNMDELLDFFKE